MEPIGMIVFAVCLFFAVGTATKSAYKGVRGTYTRRRDDWAKANPGASRVAQRAAALGSIAATMRYGGPAIKHGWRFGWSDGWARGKEWAAQHKPVQPEPDAAPTPRPSVDPSATQQAGGDQRQAAAPTQRVDGRPNLRAVPASQPDPQPSVPIQPNNPKGTPDMVETATGGEVVNAETNLAEANAAVKEYAADFEDAGGDEQRAKEDLTRIEVWTASIAKAKAPQQRVAEVAKLLEPAKQRLAAAESRKVAASNALALAKAVQESAAQDMQQMGKAVGPWYGN
jgi:hypothetical protein